MTWVEETKLFLVSSPSIFVGETEFCGFPPLAFLFLVIIVYTVLLLSFGLLFLLHTPATFCIERHCSPVQRAASPVIVPPAGQLHQSCRRTTSSLESRACFPPAPLGGRCKHYIGLAREQQLSLDGGIVRAFGSFALLCVFYFARTEKLRSS